MMRCSSMSTDVGPSQQDGAGQRPCTAEGPECPRRPAAGANGAVHRAARALVLFSLLAMSAQGFLGSVQPARPSPAAAGGRGALAAAAAGAGSGPARWAAPACSGGKRRLLMSTLADSHATAHTAAAAKDSGSSAFSSHAPSPHAPSPAPSSSLPEQPKINQYPVFPRAAVNIVVVRARPLNMGREYLFVQRSKEPGTNQWALPGGSVELGEEMLVAAAREVAEETTLDDRHLQFYPRCFMTTDAIYNDDAGAVKYHFVISQMVCWAAAEAEPVAADDAKDIRWMTLPQLRGVNEKGRAFRGVVEVIETVERLVDVGCITKADLVRVPVEVDPSLLPGPDAKRAQPSSALDIGGDDLDRGDDGHLIPKRR